MTRYNNLHSAVIGETKKAFKKLRVSEKIKMAGEYVSVKDIIFTNLGQLGLTTNHSVKHLKAMVELCQHIAKNVPDYVKVERSPIQTGFHTFAGPGPVFTHIPCDDIKKVANKYERKFRKELKKKKEEDKEEKHED